MCILENRLPQEPVYRKKRIGLTAAATTESATVSAETGNQKNPDNPFAATVVSAPHAVSASAVIVTSTVSSTASDTVSVTAEEQQDNPNPASASPVVILCTSAVVVATAVSSS